MKAITPSDKTKRSGEGIHVTNNDSNETNDGGTTMPHS